MDAPHGDQYHVLCAMCRQSGDHHSHRRDDHILHVVHHALHHALHHAPPQNVLSHDGSPIRVIRVVRVAPTRDHRIPNVHTRDGRDLDDQNLSPARPFLVSNGHLNVPNVHDVGHLAPF